MSRAIEDLGEHRYLVADGPGAGIVIVADHATINAIGIDGVEEQRIISVTIDYLTRRQDPEDLPRELDLNEVDAAYDDFRDEVRTRLAGS